MEEERVWKGTEEAILTNSIGECLFHGYLRRRKDAAGPVEKEQPSRAREDGEKGPSVRKKEDSGWGGGDRTETRIEAILGQGTRVKYRRTGKLLPDVRFRPLSLCR